MRAGAVLPESAMNHVDAARAEAQESPARRKLVLLDHAGGGEDVVNVRHRLHETGVEFAEADALTQGWTTGFSSFPFGIGISLGEAELELSVFTHVAQKIGARGFALDETDLGKLVRGN